MYSETFWEDVKTRNNDSSGIYGAEENIRAREKRYGVKRGETVHIIIDIKDEGQRTIKVSRRMQVVDLCEHHIVLRHKTGACESYPYQEFMQMWDRR